MLPLSPSASGSGSGADPWRRWQPLRSPLSRARASAPPPPPVPFAHLSSLSLSNCRPLGYSGLAQLVAGPKLRTLVWHGVEQERKIMQSVQTAAVKANKDAVFYYHKGT